MLRSNVIQAKKTTVDGITFDSEKESKRYIELNNLLLKRNNYIRKNGISNDSLDGVQRDIAKTVSEIMDEN